MAFGDSSNLKMTIIDNFDHTIQENGNAYIALRRVKWSEEAPIKLDLRHYVTNSDGDEVMKKGICFDDEAANELTNVLVNNGYGDTTDIVNGIKDREDFNKALRKALSAKDKASIEDEFDMDLSSVDEEDEGDIEEDFYDIRGEMLG